jgi:hypothetical protein
MKASDNIMWMLVESLRWTRDNDFKRIQKELKSKLSKNEIRDLENFCREKHEALYDKYESDWLANPGIEVSDDGWNDLRAEIVGRGKKFYNNITVEKMQEMALYRDYEENFLYSFQI